MTDPLERVLELVAEGRLTAAQAAPILDALGASSEAANAAASGAEALSAANEAESLGRGAARAIRLEISEGGRKVVNLRIPVALGRFALDRVPGLAGSHADMVRQAIAEGRSGVLLNVEDEDGDGVRITLD